MFRFLFFIFYSTLFYGQNIDVEKISQSLVKESENRIDSIAKALNFKPGEQIKAYVQFSINEEGYVVDVVARSIHPLIEKEAIRVVSELPRMTPPKKNGKSFEQRYSLPLIFEIETEKEKEKQERKEKRRLKKQPSE